MLLDQIKALAHQWAPEFVAVRRHLHAHPELSYQEWETATFVREKLAEFGIECKPLANTGVVGLIHGNHPHTRTIALRADMDALPIQEENQVPYASTRQGIMHACGHDVHTSVLLGAAKVLQNLRDRWEGTIKLIFQPGEEKNPGGASIMIREGVLENPAPQAIYGLHVHPGMEAGKLSFRSGEVMASSDELYFTIRGKGGHAAAPHTTTDTILIASHLVVALQQIVSRNRNPLSPSVLTIASIQGGFTTNVIPKEVKLMGTFRAMDESWRQEAHALIRRVAEGVVHGMGGELDMHIDVGYPVVRNHPLLNQNARELAEIFLGKDQVSETEMRMGSEDFGFYTSLIPGCFFRLGVMNESRGISSGVHTPTFDVDESALETGIGVMAWLGAMARL